MALTAREAAARAGRGDGVIGWALDETQRTELLMRFPPKFSEVVADHVTLAAKVRRDAELPSETAAAIIGWIDDGAGVDALVVTIDGSPDRPDGSIYHITWSLAPGRKARESNDVIARLGWRPLDLPMPVTLAPSRWP